MPPLILPSPVLVDHTFPRDDQQLRLVAAALGEVISCLERNDAHLLLTAILRDLVESYDWNRSHTLVHEIYRSLAQLFLQPNERTVSVDVSQVGDHRAHPVPNGTAREEMVTFWADEVGKILVLHDRCLGNDGFFIGVASEFGFADEPVNEYENPENLRTFPLVGLADLNTLADAYEWETPNDLHLRSISFADAKKNLALIGATRVDNPGGGSHYIAKFEGSRSWPLDRNVDPLPDRFLKQLVPISGYPFAVVKTALLTGELPPTTLKLARVATCLHAA